MFLKSDITFLISLLTISSVANPPLEIIFSISLPISVWFLISFLKRYDTYMETTKPVLDFYSKNPHFHEIDGSLEIDQITNKIEAFLEV